MIITDTLSNFFSKIKNGYLAKKNKINQFKSKQIINILNVLIKEGLIRSYRISKKKKNIIYIYLKYKNKKPTIQQIIRISKPSRRIYIKNKERKVRNKNKEKTLKLLLSIKYGALNLTLKILYHSYTTELNLVIIFVFEIKLS